MKRLIAGLLCAALLVVPLAANAAGLTISNYESMKMGSVRGATATVTFDSSYPTGGESLTPEMLGLDYAFFVSCHADSGKYWIEYNYSTAKLMVYSPSDTVAIDPASLDVVVPADDGTNPDTVAVNIPSFNVPVPGDQVANTTDLSALVVNVFAIGR